MIVIDDQEVNFIGFLFHESSHSLRPRLRAMSSKNAMALLRLYYYNVLSNFTEIGSVLLTFFGVALKIEIDLLPLSQRAHTGPLNGADMHKHIAAAIIGLDKAEAF